MLYQLLYMDVEKRVLLLPGLLLGLLKGLKYAGSELKCMKYTAIYLHHQRKRARGQQNIIIIEDDINQDNAYKLTQMF